MNEQEKAYYENQGKLDEAFRALVKDLPEADKQYLATLFAKAMQDYPNSMSYKGICLLAQLESLAMQAKLGR